MQQSLSMRVVVVYLLLYAVSFAAAEEAYHPNRLIVRFWSQQGTANLAASAQNSGAAEVRPILRRLSGKGRAAFAATSYLYVFSDSAKRLAAESMLSRQPYVESVERDYRIELFYDPQFENQWGLRNQGERYLGIIRTAGDQNDTLTYKTGISGADIKWVSARTASASRHKTRVGVIDTGVDYKHPDLANHIWRNAGEIPFNGIDDDFNGYADDYYGYDFSGDVQTGFTVSPDPDPMDQVGHGTHCAGIIGAEGGNGIGIEGIAPNVEIMCLKIFPNAFISAMTEAIVYAVDNGAEVINASWGSPYYSSLMDDAVKYAVAHDVLFVAAAGNSGASTTYYPAKFDEVLTVAASDSRDRVTAFSTFGKWVDLAAPGLDILSLRAAGTDMYAASSEPGVRIIDSLYYLADGTSMATPVVVGAAAFLLSVSPGLSADSVRELLCNTADDIADPNGSIRHGFNVYSGHGRINLGRAVQSLADEFAELESPQFNALQEGMIAFVGSAYSAAGGTFVLEAKPPSANLWVLIASGGADKLRDTLAVWNSSGYDGRTEIRLTVGQSVVFTSYLRLVNNQQIEIISPVEGDTVSSFKEIIGSASMPGFRSYEVSYYADANPKEKKLIARSSEIVYRSQLAEWTVGAVLPGSGMLRLTVSSETGVFEMSRRIRIANLIAAGYPKLPPSRPHNATAIGNVDGDPALELVTGSTAKIIVNHFAEGRLESYSPSVGSSCQSAPALWDFNNDGKDEIVIVTDSGVEIIDGEGNAMPGWPKQIVTGWQYDAYPTPLITDMDGDSSMEVLLVNAGGEIWCWRSNGDGYFHSGGGLFALISDRGEERIFGGALVPFLFASDFNDDGYQDVGTLYSWAGRNGLYMFSGKNGHALYPEKGARVLETERSFGGVLADFDRDGHAEIAFVHRYGGSLIQIGVSVVRADGSYLPGWPKSFVNKIQFLSPYPAAAYLDGDSLPELICVFSALDGGELYVWHGDGTAFAANTFGRNDGFLAGTTNSLSNPLVLDVDNDGQYEIVSRAGATLMGKPERVFAWELDGTVTRGWPIYTYADPSEVIYSLFTPAVGDFDADGLLELYMPSNDQQLYCWDLPTVASDSAVVWGSFLHDKRHSGTLPFTRQEAQPRPRPPIPTGFRLAQNFPNPFNQNTVIEVDLPLTGELIIDVFNTLGQRVATVFNGTLDAGFYRFDWNASDRNGQALASGVYFYRLRTGDHTETRKMVLLK
jgi:hypothetical protein